jgi:threonyl-tRNA synthetase
MRFNLEYVDKDGQKKTPVVLHRAVFGSIDRFMAFYLEETKGSLPLWLSPVQVEVMPITDKQLDYAKQVADKLRDLDIRAELDDRNEKIGYKIREAQVHKVPYMLVIGDKEVEAKSVGVRHRKEGDLGAMPLEDFMKKVKEQIEKYELD